MESVARLGRYRRVKMNQMKMVMDEDTFGQVIRAQNTGRFAGSRSVATIDAQACYGLDVYRFNTDDDLLADVCEPSDTADGRHRRHGEVEAKTSMQAASLRLHIDWRTWAESPPTRHCSCHSTAFFLTA